MQGLPLYTASRYRAFRRQTIEVKVGSVGVGGHNPIRIQSMTNTPTLDVDSTVKQSIALAEAGCEIVRITAQNVEAARALGPIRKAFTAAGFGAIPLVADIHFLPAAAMEAAEHVEKVRINPGNYADKKKFAVKEYSDALYDEELQRLYDAFSPIVLKCKKLGRAMRIGTNHGSLSDRIMNRYGDTPLGMCESALEFLRIAESHGFRNIVLSMKASNPKVMIQAYRLVVARMAQENMRYPLHLGVTEAGDGDDARIKSAIGIGSLLWDGLGDTIRVSLTEDPVYEIPVAIDLARKAEELWSRNELNQEEETKALAERDSLDPYSYKRREIVELNLSPNCKLSTESHPAVIVAALEPLSSAQTIIANVIAHNSRYKEAKVEGLLLRLTGSADFPHLLSIQAKLADWVECFVLDCTSLTLKEIDALLPQIGNNNLLHIDAHLHGAYMATQVAEKVIQSGKKVLFNADPVQVADLQPIASRYPQSVLFSVSYRCSSKHNLGTHRSLIEQLTARGLKNPFVICCTQENTIAVKDFYGDRLLESAILAGGLLCDGIGDAICIENEPNFTKAVLLGYNILQGSRARRSKTEFVACPSCGRTLFDLQTTTQRIRERTGHLKGVTIAVMGCIVNGPGEMADADFGYVGGAPGKVNLYVGKTCVQYNIPTEEAVDRLVDLIKEHDKWVEPEVPAYGA